MNIINETRQDAPNMPENTRKLDFSSLADKNVAEFQAASPETRAELAKKAESSLHEAAIELVNKSAERFLSKIGSDTATLFVRDIATMKKKLEKLGIASADEKITERIASSAAGEIGSRIITIWEKTIFPAYDDREDYPNNDEWREFVDASSYCTVIIERAIDLSGDEATRANVERYASLCKIHDVCIDSCGWSFDMHGTNVNITNTIGKSWHKDRCLSEKEIKERRRRIGEYEKRMALLRRQIADREYERTEEEQERYWSEHPEEYQKRVEEEKNAAIYCAERIAQGEELLKNGDKLHAALAFWEGKDFERSRCVLDFSTLIGAGQSHTVGVMPDGKVVTAGDGYDGNGTDMRACNTGSWKNIVAVAVSNFTTIGLKRDGKVVATGMNTNGQMNLGTWREIRQISASSRHSVAIRADGFVLAEGDDSSSQCKTHKWENVKTVSAGRYHTMALLNDGTVKVCGVANNGRAATGEWRDIVMIAAGGGHSVGLCADGTVVACGQNDAGQCNTESWHDIVSIGAGALHTVGVRADGTVVACGANDRGQCNVEQWHNVIAVACGNHTVGLCKDGSVICAGDNIHHQNEANGWNLFSCEAAVRRERIDAKAAPLTEQLDRMKSEYRELGFYQRGKRKQVWREIVELEKRIEELS